jgi:hypothetical protein
VYKEIKHYNQIDFARDEMLKPFAPIHCVRILRRFDCAFGHFVVMTNKGEMICPDGLSEKEVRESYAITDVLGLYK